MKPILLAAATATLLMALLIHFARRSALNESVPARYRQAMTVLLVIVFYLYMLGAVAGFAIAASEGLWPHALFLFAAMLVPFLVTRGEIKPDRANREIKAFEISLTMSVLVMLRIAMLV